MAAQFIDDPSPVQLLFFRGRSVPAEAVLARHQRAGPGSSELVGTLLIPAVGDLGKDLDDRRLVTLHAIEVAVVFKLLNESEQENLLAIRQPPDQPGKSLNEASLPRVERFAPFGDNLPP